MKKHIIKNFIANGLMYDATRNLRQLGYLVTLTNNPIGRFTFDLDSFGMTKYVLRTGLGGL